MPSQREHPRIRPIIIRPLNLNSSNQLVRMIDLSKTSISSSHDSNLSIYTIKPVAAGAPIVTLKGNCVGQGKDSYQELAAYTLPQLPSGVVTNTSNLTNVTSNQEMQFVNAAHSKSNTASTNNIYVPPNTYLCPEYYVTIQPNNSLSIIPSNTGPEVTSVRSLARKVDDGIAPVDVTRSVCVDDSTGNTEKGSLAIGDNSLRDLNSMSNIYLSSDSSVETRKESAGVQNDLPSNIPEALSRAKTDVLNGLRSSNSNSPEKGMNILPYTALKSALENKYYPILPSQGSFSPQSRNRQGRMSCSPKKCSRDCLDYSGSFSSQSRNRQGRMSYSPKKCSRECLDYSGKVAVVTPTARKRLLQQVSHMSSTSPKKECQSSPKRLKLMSKKEKSPQKQNRRKKPIALEPITISDDEAEDSPSKSSQVVTLTARKSADLSCEETLSGDEGADGDISCLLDDAATILSDTDSLETHNKEPNHEKEKSSNDSKTINKNHRTVRIHPNVPLSYTPEQVRELKSNFYSAFSVDMSQLPKIEDCLDVVPVYTNILSALEAASSLERYKTRHLTAHQMFKYVRRNYLQRVIALLLQGCDPAEKIRLEHGKCCLHAASTIGNIELLLCLLYGCGTSVDVADNSSVTPLMAAAAKDQLAAVKLIYRCGGSLDKTDSEGKSVIHICASNKAHNVLRWLCPKVKNINMQDNGGWTPLMWSSDEKSGISTKILLDHGASPFLVDEERNHCLHWAVLAGSKSGCHDLIQAGSPINGINVHQETPLHIAVKEGNFDIVQMLLLNGANTTIENKEKNTPRQLAIPGSRIDAILAVKGFFTPTTKSVMYCSDFTRGKEKVAISCINDVDDCPAPDMCYITENVETGSVHISPTSKFFQGCKCEGNCQGKRACSCVELTEELTCWYNEDGILNLEVFDLDRPALYECSRFCRCWSTCVNRVVQRGIRLPLQIFKTIDRGWGLRSLEDIPKGTYICSYLGEVLSDDEANMRADDTYLFDLDVKDCEDITCIDASFYGNVARFINHSCEANIIPIRVFYGHRDVSMPEMAFFALRDIEPLEEICLDYGEKYWSVKMLSGLYCNCEHNKCRYKQSNSNQNKLNEL